MLNKDSFLLGVVLGVITPPIVFGFLYLILFVINAIATNDLSVKMSILQIVSITVNAFIFRYYFIGRKYDKTGRGVLLITFIYFILFFLIVHKWQI
ncbi:MAG: hypothetical protein NT175_12835 [Bacteroidetes bacterium]|nr:hypothetical protein [Bacteroidota bacterium]